MRCDLWSQQCELGAQFCELCVCVCVVYFQRVSNKHRNLPTKIIKVWFVCWKQKGHPQNNNHLTKSGFYLIKTHMRNWTLQFFCVVCSTAYGAEKNNNISYKYLFGGKQKSKQTRKKLRWTMNVKSMLRCNFAQSVALYRFWNSTENNRKMWLPRRRKCDLYTDLLTHSTRINIIYLDRKWIRMLDFIFDKHRRSVWPICFIHLYI